MTTITREIGNEIVNLLKADKVLKKYIYDSIWISGSSTKVYPISITNTGVEVQLWNNKDWNEFLKTRDRDKKIRKLSENLFKGFFKRLLASNLGWLFDENVCGFVQSDGSCPAYLYLNFKGCYDDMTRLEGEFCQYNYM